MIIDPVTRVEILSQPDAWTAALSVLSGQARMIQDIAPAKRYSQIFFTGCGSTYYLSMAAAATTQAMMGLPCRAFPASELWLNPSTEFPALGFDISNTYYGSSPYGDKYGERSGKTLLVAISRSG